MDGRRISRFAVALTLALALAVAALGGARAQAATVLVMGHDGHVRHESNRYIATSDSVAPAAAAGKPKPAAPAVTVPTVLAKLLNSGQITPAQRDGYRAAWYAALSEEKHLSRARAAQLDAVTEMLHDMAVTGKMTASRLPVLFLTLQRNAQWWKSGPMLSYGQRVQFAGSELEWEYYTGEGIQLQVLGTFGEADGFYEAGKSSWPDLVAVMDEMIPLAVQRGGGLAWEYYFDWEGGSPPWVSAMAQATGLEALTNAYLATGEVSFLTTAHEALGILQTPPPTGVAVKTALGSEFLQYSFAPGTDIINAFLQTLIGLDHYAKVSGDPAALALFTAGDAQAMAVLPAFNTGGWSLYQPGEADPLSYHELVTGFLGNLCTLTATPIYCATHTDFEQDLTTPPVLTQVTKAVSVKTASAKGGFRLYFTLDKPAHVGVIVSNARGKDLLYTSSECGIGSDYWIVPRLKAGRYTVRLSGTDLAGNYATTSGTLTVGAAPPSPGGGTTTTGTGTTTTPGGTTTTPAGTGTTTTPGGTSTTGTSTTGTTTTPAGPPSGGSGV